MYDPLQLFGTFCFLINLKEPQVAKIVRRASAKSGILRKITPQMLRHSFATHLLEDGTDIRYIQTLLGHSSTKTTKIHTQVALNNFKSIRNPLDLGKI
ncbi:tyrosine-type recombinase/integrase [Aquimarina sp. TRL1]|uniref:tyrosine-type recombinase/integrase n=1 Tax=Aquimarina sp. (strain TRL1) TaxID=2736252 RepID=UPI00158E159E|nr:tyrosine-type recombinase/integrase [Aquimarina sp. TRL1]QKX07637.1 tyrosine-type recombinase/integrase [Aquimarina sp. TRL1]